MVMIRDVTPQWSAPVTLQNDEIWQARSGSVYITTTEQPESDDGLSMVLRDGLRVSAGMSLRYRKEGDTAALIVREAVQ